MSTEDLKELICRNAHEIVRLDSRVHETYKVREQSDEKHLEWHRACVEFQARYDQLRFPGGYDRGMVRDRVSEGEPHAMEAAVCFLELRPYFFGSGYMFEELLRRCKRAPLSTAQAARLDVVIQRLLEWRQTRGKQTGARQCHWPQTAPAGKDAC
ncbi:hypothetical protein [Granulicella rosea]|uniref:hypothetical protein n=1 Tax=Granulicella rosea TaxID=474952 RepID=UPI00115E1E85|nr:hypothetical protein [Granulicella rosea]